MSIPRFGIELNAHESVKVERQLAARENKGVFLLQVWFVVLVFLNRHASHHVVRDRVTTVETEMQLTPHQVDAFVISGAAGVSKLDAGVRNEPLDSDKRANTEASASLLLSWSDEFGIPRADIGIGRHQTLDKSDDFFGDVKESLACLRDSSRVVGAGRNENSKESESENCRFHETRATPN